MVRFECVLRAACTLNSTLLPLGSLKNIVHCAPARQHPRTSITRTRRLVNQSITARPTRLALEPQIRLHDELRPARLQCSAARRTLTDALGNAAHAVHTVSRFASSWNCATSRHTPKWGTGTSFRSAIATAIDRPQSTGGGAARGRARRPHQLGCGSPCRGSLRRQGAQQAGAQGS